MAITVNDIVPVGSGAGHLGVDGNAVGAFDITSIAPFGHIFQISGVLVDPLHGQSGILRFALDRTNLNYLGLQFSSDGGSSFSDLVGSGQIIQIINETVTAHTLQAAYNGDPDIDLALEAQQGGYDPITLSMNVPGVNPSTSGIAILGHTPADENQQTQTEIGAGLIFLKASGTSDIQAASSFIGYVSTPTLPAFGNQLILRSTGPMLVTASGVTIFAGGTPSPTAGAGSINLTSIFDAINLNSFGGSGRLTYRFGPYEAWHTSPSHTSDFFPIPHSGQVREVATEIANSTFATNFSSQIFFDSLNITADKAFDVQTIAHNLSANNLIIQVYQRIGSGFEVFQPDSIVLQSGDLTNVYVIFGEEGQFVINILALE